MTDMVYYYDGSFEGFLCCIFESYACKEVPIAIYCDEDDMPTLFASRTIQTNRDHANRVLRKVVKCSPYAAELLHKGYLTCLPDRELYLYRLVAKLLREGPSFLRNFSDETLHPVASAVRHLDGEAHLLKGFVRFSEMGGVLGSEIEPKNRVLPLLRSHFCARYREEKFFIYDRTHQVLAQGNFVLAVSEGTFGGAHTSYYDLWRMEDDRIAEHWDVMEPIAEKETWANQNGKF